MAAKKTIKNKVAFSGVGIHSGKPVRIELIPSHYGEIIFKRSDLGNVEFPLDPKNIKAENSTMLVTEKGRIRTLEHLLAALWVYGIDSLTIVMDQEEIPAMDGSALPFVQAVHRAGVEELPAEKKPVKIDQPFILKEEDSSVSVVPDAEFKLTYHIDYDHPVIKKQGFSIVLNPVSFEEEIAPARTFGFLEDVPDLQKRGLALGGSLENAVVLDKTQVISGPLRSPDEFVRHKILDLVGDLSLLGNPVKGHFIAKKAGHQLHLRVVRFLLENPEYLSPDT
jgi:UDP-3-O-[3-hydroxymyristoyl] N-acetylglucosamine deacetylase